MRRPAARACGAPLAPYPLGMRSALLVAWIALAAPQEPTAPPPAAPVPPRFAAGESARLELVQRLELEAETRIDSRSEIGRSRLTTRLRLGVEILGVSEAGGATLAVVLERLEAEVEDASGRTRWDSESGRAEPPDSPRADLLAELARLRGARIEVDLDRDHRLLSRRGTEALAERLGIAPSGPALEPLFPWIWVGFPRGGASETLVIDLPVDPRDAAPAAPGTRGPSVPRVEVVLRRAAPESARGERADDAIVELAIAPRETRGAGGARRSLQGRGRFAFDASTGLLRSGELETTGMGSREAWLQPGRALRVASENRARTHLAWRRVGP
jgi:hypothetical protein